MLSYLLTAYNRFNLNYSIRETEPRDSVLFFKIKITERV